MKITEQDIVKKEYEVTNKGFIFNIFEDEKGFKIQKRELDKPKIPPCMSFYTHNGWEKVTNSDNHYHIFNTIEEVEEIVNREEDNFSKSIFV